MLRSYGLTVQEWEQAISLLPPEKPGKPGHPAKGHLPCLTGCSGFHAA